MITKRKTKTRDAHSLRMALLVVAAGLAGLGLCGCGRSAKAPANTAARSSKPAIGSTEIYCTWEATRKGTLLTLPLDVESKKTLSDSLLVVELGKSGDSVRKVIDGGPFASWSPEGNQLAFNQEVAREINPGIRGARIGLYSSDTGSLAWLSNGGYVDRDPVWKYDGSAIAFERLEFGDVLKGQYAKCHLVIVPISGGVFKEAQARSYQVVDMAAEALQWRPLSNEIAYVGVGRSQLENNKRTRLNDIYLLDAGTGKTRKLTDSGDVERYSVGWSPDGKRIAFATGVERLQSLEIMNVSTGKRKWFCSPPIWRRSCRT